MRKKGEAEYTNNIFYYHKSYNKTKPNGNNKKYKNLSLTPEDTPAVQGPLHSTQQSSSKSNSSTSSLSETGQTTTKNNLTHTQHYNSITIQPH